MKEPFVIALALLCSLALAQTTAPTHRLRGTVKSFDGSALVLTERSGETDTLAMADTFSISEVVPIEPSAIRVGSFIGTAASFEQRIYPAHRWRHSSACWSKKACPRPTRPPAAASATAV